MRIAVIGASRGTGRAVVAAALARGHSVAGLARSPAPLADQGLKWMTGDAREPEVIARLVAGSDAVVSALGTSDIIAKTTLFSESAQAVLQGMNMTHVTRLVVVTGAGAGDSTPNGGFFLDRIAFPLFLGRIYRDKSVQEGIIKASGLDWTIVRPGLLTKGPASGKVTYVLPGRNYRLGRISRADLAGFVLDCIETASFVRQTPFVGVVPV